MSMLTLLSKLKNSAINIKLEDNHLKINAPKGKLTPDLVIELKEHKEEIIQFLKQVQTQVEYKSIEPVEKKEFYPLSSAQKRLYFLQQLGYKGIFYNIPYIIPWGEDLTPELLENIFSQLTSRHESLRTSFEIIAEEAMQKIYPHVELNIEYYEPGNKQEAIGDPSPVTKSIIKNFIRPFDLSQAPLFRVGLIAMAQRSLILLVDMHHIISDGTSEDILAGEFITLFQGAQLPPLRLQYKDYAQWQNNKEQQRSIRQQQAYWQNLLADELPVLHLPTDFPRPPMQSFEGNTLHFVLDKEETKKIKQLTQKLEATLYMTVLCMFNIFLHKLSNQEDIIVGTPVAGRMHPDFENIIGMFVNTLPMRNYPAGFKTVKTFLKEVKVQTLKAHENQDFQFDELVEQLNIHRDTSRNPIFDVMCNFLDEGENPQGTIVADEHNREEALYRNPTAKFDLILTAMSREDQLLFELEYCTRLFKKPTIQRMIGYFKKIASWLPMAGDIKIAHMEIITREEKTQLLTEFNDTEAPFPLDKTIHQLFEEQVEKSPDQLALIYEHQQITYRELNKRSNQLAGFLRNRGVKPDDVVGIIVQRSIEMIVSILGILKAGGGYSPIDPQFPAERKAYMLKESAVKLLLTNIYKENPKEFTYLLEAAPTIEVIDVDRPHIYCGETANLTHTNQPAHLLYLLYTSGSTGLPKGVMLQHQNLVNLMIYGFKCTNMDFSAVLQFYTICFDVSFQEVFSALLSGGKLCLIPEDTRTNILELFKVIEKNQTRTLFFPVSLLKVIFNEDSYARLFPHCVNHIQAAGEQVVISEKFRTWLKKKNIWLHNHYGPTESHVVTAFSMSPTSEIPGLPPIGKPVSNTIIYILDHYGGLQPIGVPGELYIGGIQVGRGYLNRMDLTHDKFVLAHRSWLIADRKEKQGDFALENDSKELPTYDEPSAMSCFYKTGDLARWLWDGNIEFLGRIDHQVKVRGFRVEPGETETQLLNHKDIQEAVVVAKEDAKGEKYLCAYVVNAKHPGKQLDIPELKVYLARKLAEYMIPTHFVQVDRIPLTPNGKVDRKALPEPGIKVGTGYVPPGNNLQQMLVDIWSEVLGIPKKLIGIDTNFFESGGHSLKATVLAAKVHKELNVKLPLAEIFQAPTIQGLARIIRDLGKERFETIEPVEEKEYYPLSSAQKRLYILQQMERDNINYNLPQVLHLEGEVDREKLGTLFKTLISCHQSLRTSIIMINEEPVQRLYDEVEFEINFLATEDTENTEGTRGLASLSEVPATHNWQPVTNSIKQFIRPFDFSKAPLLRVGLIQTQKNQYILVIDIHHIITDGISQDIMTKEFTGLYAGKQLSPLRLHYKDYSEWQRLQQQKEKMNPHEKFWIKQFEDEIPVLNLPLDYPRPPVKSFAGKTIPFNIPAEQIRKLTQLALENGTTFYTILLGINFVLLSRLSGQENIVIGTPIAGRIHADLEQVIGMLVNTLALRGYPTGEKPFTTFLTQLGEKTVAAFENQAYPFEDLVEKLVPTRDTSRNALFDVMFILQNIYETPEKRNKAARNENNKVESLKVKTYNEYEYEVARFDITLTAIQVGEKVEFEWEYCSKLFKQDTIVRFIQYFKNLISSVLENPGKKISKIEIMTEEEKKQQLMDFNRTNAEYPRNKTIHRLFEEQIEKKSDHIAIIDPGLGVGTQFIASDPGTQNLHLTYNRLNKKSNQLAHLLKSRGVLPNIIVGIMMERSIHMIISILAILKAGGAYLPIDLSFPEERKKYIFKDSNTCLLLTQTSFIPKPSIESSLSHFSNREIIPIDGGDHTLHLSSANSSNPGHINTPADLVYIIYTSGSTGHPKGVQICHQGMVNYVVWGARQYVKDEAVNFPLYTSISFDLTVTSIFTPLITGNAIVVYRESPGYLPLEQIIRENRVGVIKVTPSHLKLIRQLEMPKTVRGIRRFIVGGEELETTLAADIFRNFNGHVEIYNEYGPTETVVGSMIYQFNPAEAMDRTVLIGYPIANTRVYILDKLLHPLPFGVAGELCIAGDGVARGYLNRPELTNEKFCLLIPGGKKSNSPANQRIHMSYMSYIYRTGDLARRLPDGNIQFLGRNDDQIKIRGFRIELGEIQQQLLTNNKVKEAVVLTRESSGANNPGNDANDRFLCAYIVASEELTADELKNYCANHLPDYMIPTFFIILDLLPLTPNGKIDRKALPEPEIKPADQYIGPRNWIEEKLVEIWAEVLGLETKIIGIDTNFFQLGGQSLRATIMVAKIYKDLNLKLPLEEVFKTPTIRGLSEKIKDLTEDKFVSIVPVEEKEYYALSSAQKRLFILHQINENDIRYNISTIEVLEVEPDLKRFEETFTYLIDRHENLRTSFEMIDEEPLQKIHQTVDFTIEYYTVGSMEHGASRMVNLEKIITDFVRPFNFSQPPLLRVGLIQTHPISSSGHKHPKPTTPNNYQKEKPGSKYILMVDMHHIITDGISSQILVDEFMTIYAGEELPSSRLQYIDYSEWQNSQVAKNALKQQEEYWLKEFEGEIPEQDMPIDYVRPETQSSEGNSINFEIDKKETERLKQLAVKEDATLFMILLAIYNILLSKLCRQEDIIVGTGIAGRRHIDLQKIIGMFVNTLVLRNYPQKDKTFKRFLAEVKRKALLAFENQDYPFEDLVEKLIPHRKWNRNPLFDTVLVLQNMETGTPDIDVEKSPGLMARTYDYRRKVTMFDLSLFCHEPGKHLVFTFEYATKLYKRETIERLITYFKDIVAQVVENSDIKLKDITISHRLLTAKTGQPEMELGF